MEEFPSNSHKKTPPGKPEEKKIEKVVEGTVVRRKQPLGKRFSQTFVQGDARSVWSYVGLEVLLPAAKDAIADAFSQGIERMLFGEARGGSRSRGPGRRTHTSYGRMSSDSRPPWDREDPREHLSRRARATHSFDQIEIPSRVEAERVLDVLFNTLSHYDAVTVADFYDAVGVTPEFTDEKYGWTDLAGTRIERVRGGGFILDLPPTEPLLRR